MRRASRLEQPWGYATPRSTITLLPRLPGETLHVVDIIQQHMLREQCLLRAARTSFDNSLVSDTTNRCVIIRKPLANSTKQSL